MYGTSDHGFIKSLICDLFIWFGELRDGRNYLMFEIDHRKKS